MGRPLRRREVRVLTAGFPHSTGGAGEDCRLHNARHVHSVQEGTKPIVPPPLDLKTVRDKFEALTRQINNDRQGSAQVTAEEVAMGFISVAIAAMTRPICTLSEGRGYETAAHNLASFGGAGG